MEKRPQHQKNNTDGDFKADRIDVVYYTDPLCCWSWAMEPQWRKLQYEFQDIISVRYCMGGLISNWNNFNDSVNSISRPVQMGPVWAEARHISGMPLYDRIWIKDPPATSYTSCVAVKCASLQSSVAEEKFLRYVREAIMLEGINISKQQSLFQIAEKLSNEFHSFDSNQFKQDFISGAGTDGFKNDLKEIRYKNINRFPTFIMTNADKKSVILSGYHPYGTLLNIFQQISKTPATSSINAEMYKSYFGNITKREIDEIAS